MLAANKDSAPSAIPTPTEGDMISMKADGNCCYEAAGCARAAANGKSVSEFGNYNKKWVDEAKVNIVLNIIEMAKECSSFVLTKDPSERVKQAEKMWQEVLAV